MDNIGTVEIIGTGFLWSWTALAHWSSLANNFGGRDQHWQSGHPWHIVLVAMVSIGIVIIIGILF